MKRILIVLLALVISLSAAFVDQNRAQKVAKIHHRNNILVSEKVDTILKGVPKEDYPAPEYLEAVVTKFNRQKIDLSWSKPFVGTMHIEDDFETGNTNLDLPVGWWQKASDMHLATSWRDVGISFMGWVALAAASYPQWVYEGNFSCGANGAGEEPYTYLISDDSFVLSGGSGVLDYAMLLAAGNEQGVFLYDGTLTETDPSDNIFMLKTYNPTADTSWFHDEIDLSAYSGTYRIGIYKAGVGGVSSFDNIRIGSDSYPAGDQPISYDIYRNVTFAVNVPITGLTETYEDNDFDDGSNEYYLQAVYGTGTSIPSESFTVFIDANPSPHLLEGVFDPINIEVDLLWYSPGHFPLHWFGYEYDGDGEGYISYPGDGELRKARTYYTVQDFGMEYPIYIEQVTATFIENVGVEDWSSDQFKFIIGTGAAGSENVLHISPWQTADPNGSWCNYSFPTPLTITENWYLEIELGSPSDGTPNVKTNVHLEGVDPDHYNSVWYWYWPLGGYDGWYATSSYASPYESEDFAFLCYGYNDEPVITKEDAKNKGLESYNVYRDSIFLANTTNKFHTDTNPAMGDNIYYVTTVYSDPVGESGPSNEVTLGPSIAISLPDSISESITVGTSDTRSFNIASTDVGTLDYELSFEYTDQMEQSAEPANAKADFSTALAPYVDGGTGVVWIQKTDTDNLDGTPYAYVIVGNTSITSTLLSGVFDGTDCQTLEFDHVSSVTDASSSMYVEYSLDSGYSWESPALYNIATTTVGAWGSPDHQSITFPSVSTTMQIRFTADLNRKSENYVGLDNIVVSGFTQLIDPWFSFISQTTGSIAGGANTNIICEYDATTLDLDSVYHVDITVISNDPDNPTVIIPVNLSVVADLPPPPDPNLQISIIGSTLTLTWNVLDGATGYYIYSSTDPYGVFTIEDSALTNSWETTSSSTQKYYYITGTDELKSNPEQKIIVKKRELK